jgi:phosphoribosylanthranilate isomerase
MPRAVKVKVCGVRRLDDAVFAIEAGAELLGINLVESSVRYLNPLAAAELVAAIRERFGPERVELVGVVSDQPPEAMLALLERTGLDTLQLHGSESIEVASALGQRAYKAVRIREAVDVAEARAYPGRRLLVDAKVDGQLGGTGKSFDWGLLGELPRERDLFLAGGLDPGNVASAVKSVRPYAVDVASGVERVPGRKDSELVARFIANARDA